MDNGWINKNFSDKMNQDKPKQEIKTMSLIRQAQDQLEKLLICFLDLKGRIGPFMKQQITYKECDEKNPGIPGMDGNTNSVVNEALNDVIKKIKVITEEIEETKNEVDV